MASYQIPVAQTRLRRPNYVDGRGLVDDRVMFVGIGQRALWGVDWLHDQHSGGMIATLEAVTKISGAGAVTVELAGEDRQQTKFWLTGTVAGDLELAVQATDREGHQAEARLQCRVA